MSRRNLAEKSNRCDTSLLTVCSRGHQLLCNWELLLGYRL